MASGKTIQMINLSKEKRLIDSRETRPRDRSLRGKARVKARKAA